MTQIHEHRAQFTLQLLGPFTCFVGNLPLPKLRTRKGQWLLALLALNAGKELDRDWLAFTLWPESDETQARGGGTGTRIGPEKTDAYAGCCW